MKLPQLKTHHWGWIWEVAAEHFANEINKQEQEIAQHHYAIQHGMGEISVPHVSREKNRLKRIEKIRESMKTNKDILTVLLALREGTSDLSAMECAEQFKEMLKGREKSDATEV